MVMEIRNCKDCKHSRQIAEHEFECTAENYDIINKTCFEPKVTYTVTGSQQEHKHTTGLNCPFDSDSRSLLDTINHREVML